MKNQNTVYALMHSSLDVNYGIELSAITDKGARRQAKKIAKINGLRDYWISFFRHSDGMRGKLDR